MTATDLAEQIEADTQALVERIDERLARVQRILEDPTPTRIWWARWRARR